MIFFLPVEIESCQTQGKTLNLQAQQDKDIRIVGLVQLIIFLVVELIHQGSNSRFDMCIAFTANYFFQWEATSMSTARHFW
jgi:hypothetical protein